MASKEIHVPDLGSFKDVAVIEVLVRPGDTVQVDTPLLTLETEKATMDVPSPDAGVVETLHVQKGARVSAGSLIATLKLADAVATPAAVATPTAIATPVTVATAAAAATSAARGTPSAAAAAATSSPTARPAAASAPSESIAADDTLRAPALLNAPSPAVSEEGIARAHASPSVRKFARELGADLLRIRGSGLKGRITEEDVKAYVKSALAGNIGAAADSNAGGPAGRAWPTVPAPDFAQFGPIEIKPLSRVQRISGPRLHASWVNLPHVTQFDEADITQLEEARKGLKAGSDVAGVKLTALAFIVRACVKALQQFPMFNSSLDARGENLIYKNYFHIGFAADTPQGLLVPVIRDANRKDIYEIARDVATLSQKARSGKLLGTDMQGGSFTISSLGAIGGTGFTPIINAPEVAILGVSRSSLKPLYQDGGFVPRVMLPLSLSYDHRVIDGVNGARFMSFLVEALADVHGLLEAVP
ncbi:MAG TPA: 2-oxo acid dehydrogenase subunit E2 [Steroidobacteraceae bacterium]|nr:2-oxo acid dehydrogenase subunit E2 [Steroidobacteraceae bacterium]